MTKKYNPYTNPRTPPAIAASKSRLPDSPLRDRAVQITPTRKASSQAIGVTQTTPGYPASDTSTTIPSHSTNWRRGTSKIVRKSNRLVKSSELNFIDRIIFTFRRSKINFVRFRQDHDFRTHYRVSHFRCR